MKFVILALALASYVVGEKPGEHPDGPYEFYSIANREFPSNSLIAGQESGLKVHIGVTALAGKVIEDRKLLEMVDDDGSVLKETENFWVITSDQPEIFHWIPARFHNIVLPPNVRPVSFGLLGRKYVARGGASNETTIGTLHCDTFPNSCGAVMGVNHKGRAQTYNEFDVMVYEVNA